MNRFLFHAALGLTAWGVLGFAVYKAMPSASTSYECLMSSLDPQNTKDVRKKCRELKGGK